MRNPRPPGPPSSVSGSSGHGLIYGVPRIRGPRSTLTVESAETKKSRKTKIIVILGVVLPVLACIIGIAAWAVTTDVLGINPRTTDGGFNRFGHQGKTRIDNMQPRSDTDVDVFLLHGITPPSSVPPSSKSTRTMLPSTTSSSVLGSSSSRPPKDSPSASDILSKLISDMPPPKNHNKFVVFAPVADTTSDTTAVSGRKGRRFDSKVVVQDDDLVAEESVISEDFPQELGPEKRLPSSRNKMPLPGGAQSLKPGMRPLSHTREGSPRGKAVNNGPFQHSPSLPESPPSLIKRPQRFESVTFPTSSKPSTNLISSRNGGPTQLRASEGIQQRNSNNHFGQKLSSSGQTFDKARSGRGFRHQQNQGGNMQTPGFQKAPHQQFHHSPAFQNQESMSVIEAPKTANQYSSDSTQGYQGYQNAGPGFGSQQAHLGRQAKFSTQQQQPNFNNVPQAPHSPEHPPQGGPQHFAPPQPNFSNVHQTGHLPDAPPQGGVQSYAPPPHPQPFHNGLNNGDQQSYAPPPHPQPFHHNGLNNGDQQYQAKFASPAPPPFATFEKVAQGAVEAGADGSQHHHHHHHHHVEPPPPVNPPEPAGDANAYSDTDRLGSIGIGMSPSRGITLQIGGGGGGLGGLLPLGTLGIVRNIAAALLPRPQLGLNSKVFLGVEVGKGGGFNVGLG